MKKFPSLSMFAFAQKGKIHIRRLSPRSGVFFLCVVFLSRRMMWAVSLNPWGISQGGIRCADPAPFVFYFLFFCSFKFEVDISWNTCLAESAVCMLFFFLLRIVLSLLLGCPQRAIVHHRPPCHPTNPARLPLLLSPLHIGGRPDKYLLPFCYNLCFNTIHYVLFWSIFF